MRLGLSGIAFLLAGCASPFGGGTVVLPTSDPAIMTAVGEARATLPLFLRNNLRTDGSFAPGSSVRVVIRQTGVDSSSTQVLWIAPLRQIGPGRFAGTVADHPTELPGMTIGNQVEFDEDAIRDWSWTQPNGTAYGCFTIRAILPWMKAEQAAQVSQRLISPAVPEEWR